MTSRTAHMELSSRTAVSQRKSASPRSGSRDGSAIKRVHGARTARYASARSDAPAFAHTKLFVFFIGIAFAVGMLYGPAREYYVAWRANIVLEQRYEAVLAENREIQEDIDRLNTQEGIEEAARSLGYVEYGESSVVVRGLPEEESVVISDIKEVELPWYVGPLDTLFGYHE